MYVYNLGLLFTTIAQQHSARPAILFADDSSISYKDLDDLSNRVASYLQESGIKKGDVIGIFNNKTAESYAIMIACLKIGAVYTNLDPNSPPNRLLRMVETCSPRLLFTYDDTLTECVGLSQMEVVNYCTSSLDFQAPFVPQDIDGDSAAYLMFTSGSTGFPKGVVITHSSVLNFITWAKYTANIKDGDTVSNLNPMHFDNSVFDFYASLFNGASLAAIPDSLLKTPRRLLDQLNKLKPTIWFSVPSLLVYILKMRALKEEDLTTLRVIIFGGEGFPKSQLRLLWLHLGSRVEFLNVYGPTEGTCICSSYRVKEKDLETDELLPLGPIAPNFHFLIVDQDLNKIKRGERGELCLLGNNLAKGYYNNSEKSAEAFIPNPYCKAYKQLMYRTGDIVSLDQSNLLHFHGRRDNQIKRMGYRIELEEIEAALGSLEYIRENAVLYHAPTDLEGKIVAFTSGEKKEVGAILKDLRNILPSYMIPNDIQQLPVLPKNQNGKIDRVCLRQKYFK